MIDKWFTILNLVRWREWQESKFLIPVIIIYYAALANNQVGFGIYAESLGLMFISFHLAAFGYMINSWFDRRADTIGGKRNLFAIMNRTKAISFLTAFAIAGIVLAASWMQSRLDVLLFILISYLLALLYSMPPIRFKEHFILGILVSTLAQRTFPTLYITTYFGVLDEITIMLILINSIIGVRHIIMHQILDYDSDLLSNTKTLARLVGISHSHKIVSYVVFPLEIISILILGIFLALQHPLSIIISGFFVLFTFLQWTYIKEYAHSKFPPESYDTLETYFSIYIPILLCSLLIFANLEYVFFAAFFVFTNFRQARNEIRLMPLIFKSIVVRYLYPITRRFSHEEYNDQIEQARQRALVALISLQDESGGFPSIQWRKGETAEPCHGLFITATILLVVGKYLPYDVIEKACNYLVSYRSNSGTWNYFDYELVPDDSDDTACVITCFVKYAPQHLTGNEATVLRNFWRGEGPFHTWLSDDARWTNKLEDDAVVNANILVALQSLINLPTKTELESVKKLIFESINGTPYYTQPSSLYYAALKAGFSTVELPYAIRWKPNVRTKLLSHVEWMLAEDYYSSNSIKHVLNKQHTDGTWKAEAWFTGTNIPYLGIWGQRQWGSNALTTAFCLAALSRCAEKHSANLESII
jgi:4-hydroxybenzoate polyprenyltransferase